jgi:uncharacterized membrane protein HdeD (DUF308 family)
MNLGQLISGGVLVIGGIVLIIVAIFNGFMGDSWVALIYGLPALIVGLVILFYKKEDKIEKIKKINYPKPAKGGRKKK